MYILYYRPTCPFCRRVLDFIEEHKIEVDLRDISEEEHAAALLEKGGKQQVPFLCDGDTCMYESDAIIEHLTGKLSS